LAHRPPAPREPDHRGAERAAQILADLAGLPEHADAPDAEAIAADLPLARAAR